MDTLPTINLDYDQLRKGDVIGRAELERLLGTRDNYTLQGRLIQLSQEIQHELRKRRKPITVRIRRFSLEFLADDAASHYNAALFRHGIRKLRKAQRQLSEVDAGQLDPDERRRHDRALVVQGAYLGAIAAARQELEPVAHRRRVPGLPTV